MAMNCPRLVVAGLSGDSGKTITSLSLLLALKRRGLRLSVFKKGPDYIDAAWLSWAAGSRCRNLDTYMVAAEDVRSSFVTAAEGSDIAIVEGNRGLFDGRDSEGTHSTASLARLLKAPVVLVINCTKTTRTVAAIVKGCQSFEPDVKLAGVILNQIAGTRHRRVITEAIEQSCRLPVLGALPRLAADSALIPGRHLGLVTPAEFGKNSELQDRLLSLAEAHLDLDRLLKTAHSAGPLAATEPERAPRSQLRARIGYFRDSVFTFYYPENLEALEIAGAELVPVSSLADAGLPEVDGLYIGGGFPETHADRLADNRSMLASVKAAVGNGLPVYAECGGLIYLCRNLVRGERTYPMAGVFAFDLVMHERPVGHGYTECRIDRDNPFFDRGTVLHGHEFHYSGPVTELPNDHGCMTMLSGIGLGNRRDGVVYKNCLAGYTHVHASGVPSWAGAVAARAAEYRVSMGRAGLAGEAEGRALQLDRAPDNSMKANCNSDIGVQPQMSGC